MIGVGISFMIMGSTHFIVTYVLKQTQPVMVQHIRKRLFYTGICITGLSIVSFFIPTPYNTILPAIPVLYFGLSTLQLTRNLFQDEQKPSP